MRKDLEKHITEVYTDRRFISACKRSVGKKWEDLRNEVAIQILGLPEEKLIDIISQGTLLEYCIRVAFFQSSPKKWTDYRKHNESRINLSFTEILNDVPYEGNDIEERELREQIEDYFLPKIEADMENQETLYHARIFVLYNQCKSTVQLSKQLRISRKNLYSTSKKYKEYLKEWAKSLQTAY